MRTIKNILHCLGIIKYSGIDLAIFNTEKAIERVRCEISEAGMGCSYCSPPSNDLHEKIKRQKKYLNRMKDKRERKLK